MGASIATDIETLARLFKEGGWSELRVETNEVSLLFSTDPYASAIGAGAAAAMPAVAPPAVAATTAPAVVVSPDEALDAGWVAVVAPNLGTFYRSPKPGAAPFVEVGQQVAAETEICLLEVMKLFTSVKAGIFGTVRRIAAADAELVEGGQALFLIEPA